MLMGGLAPGVYAFLFAGVALGAVVQRLSGQAFGMIAAPLTALAAPERLPATILILGFVVGLGALGVDLKAVRWREAAPGGLGRLLGGILGAAIVAALPAPDAIAVAVALIVLAAVAVSLSGVVVPIRPATLIGAGLAAGVMGTITAIGAPPMAILYSREAARRARAMQNLFFLWGMAVSLAALAAFGAVARADLVLAAWLSPAAGLGLLAAGPAARRMAARPIRPWALGLATLAALSLLARHL